MVIGRLAEVIAMQLLMPACPYWALALLGPWALSNCMNIKLRYMEGLISWPFLLPVCNAATKINW